MDDTSPQRIDALKEIAATLITTDHEKIDTLCQLLTTEAPAVA